MSAQLPPSPSSQQLKKQAKKLLKAHQDADPDAISRIRGHLPRLAHASDDEILAATFGLQEAQHVIATEYGFKNWTWLQAVAQPDLELLGRLTDREIQTLTHDADRRDLAAALTALPARARDKLLRNMSKRARTGIEEEMEFLGQISAPEIAAAQLNAPRLEELMARRLDDLSTSDVQELAFQLAELARQEGILAWDAAADGAADPFVQEALRLAADGTEAPLLADILATRSERAVLAQRETRGRLVIAAMACISACDSPAIIAHKLSAYYEPEAVAHARPSAPGDSAELQRDLREQLAAQTVESMNCQQLAEMLTRIGELARRGGMAALTPLASAAADRMLRDGLRSVADGSNREQLILHLETQLRERLEAIRCRHRMVSAGAEAVQRGSTPEQVVATVVAVLPSNASPEAESGPC